MGEWIEIAHGCAMPREAFRAPPTINSRHIDGPVLQWAGQMHWLTWRELLAVWFWLEDAESLAQKHWPQRKDFAPPAPDGGRGLREDEGPKSAPSLPDKDKQPE
jgi:hypothetical protein